MEIIEVKTRDRVLYIEKEKTETLSIKAALPYTTVWEVKEMQNAESL